MNFNKNQTLTYTSKLSDFEVINSEFTKCKCYALASGDNTNGSDITVQAIDKAISRGEFYNKPIVAHLYKDEDNGSWRVGGHDSKWVISNTGIEVINETIPFGTIPESSHIRKEEVVEPDGITVNTYVVMDIILWTGRFNIMDAAYSDDVYFNQSCEISVNDYCYKDNGIIAINDFTFSALCLLNKSDDATKNVLPCFPSCRVEKIKSFSIDETSFKQNFDLMLKNLKQYGLDNNTSIQNNKTTKKGGDNTMDNSKIVDKLSAYTYENTVGETVPKYSLIDSTETSIGVVDRENNKVYSFDCTESDGEIVIDMDSKTECSMTYKDFNKDNCFDYSNEIVVAQKTRESEVSKSFSDMYTAKIDEITATYTQLKSDYDAMSVEFEKYKKADDERIEKEKHLQIDAVIDKYAKKIGRLPKFLCYRAKVDYSKSVADIENELILMAGEAMMDTNKQSFSYNPTVSNISEKINTEKYSHESRYGNLFDKFLND